MKRRQGVVFAVFCLLGGSRWLVDGAVPAVLPLFEQESLHYAVIGMVALAILLFRKRPAFHRRRLWLRLSAAGVLLLGLPSILGEVAHQVPGATRVALFALVPLLVVVVVASFGQEAGVPPGRTMMMPALVGLSGVLLLLPFQFPLSVHAALFYGVTIVAVLLTAVGSIWMRGLLQDCDIAFGLAILCGSNAVVLALAASLQRAVMPSAGDLAFVLFRGAVLDLPLLLLLVWLLQQLPPTRLAVRFLIIPLLSAIEGAVLLRSPIEWRMGLGILLIVGASGALLFGSEVDESETMPGLGLEPRR